MHSIFVQAYNPAQHLLHTSSYFVDGSDKQAHAPLLSADRCTGLSCTETYRDKLACIQVLTQSGDTRRQWPNASIALQQNYLELRKEA